MLFFALIGVVTIVTGIGLRLLLPAPAQIDWRGPMRVGLAFALTFAGVDHLVVPERYMQMMPDFVPFPEEVIFLTGLCEIAGAAGLFLPNVWRLTGILLAIYFVCVFPANIKNAVEGIAIPGMPEANWYYWVRLFFQPFVIWWALYASTAIDWPFRRTAGSGE